MHKEMDSGDLSQELTAIIREGSAADALVLISLQPDPAVAALAISTSVNQLYKSHRDIKSMVVAAYLGISWCLGQASLTSDRAVATTLNKRAHAMSFNAAANCWPGWGDEGVTIEDGDAEAARSLAGLCLALAEELELGPKGVGTAHWLIGALDLALGRFEQARAAFQEAQRAYSNLGEEAPQTLMAKGYDALARNRREDSSDETISALKASVERLRATGTKDGQFFADQIERAEQVLSARSAI